jgi:hypothetical protein
VKVQVKFIFMAFDFSGVPRKFFVGVQQIQLRTEGRENGDLVPLNLQMNKAHVLIKLLPMYIPRNWEFGSALVKLQKLGGGGGV